MRFWIREAVPHRPPRKTNPEGWQSARMPHRFSCIPPSGYFRPTGGIPNDRSAILSVADSAGFGTRGRRGFLCGGRDYEFGSGSVRVRISGFGVRYGSALYKSRNLRTTGTSLMNHMPPAAIGSDQTVRKQYLSNVGKVCFPVCANADFLRLAVPIFQRQPCRARTL